MPQSPLTDHTPTKLTRNQEIRERYGHDETVGGLRDFRAAGFAGSAQATELKELPEPISRED
jgi:hypothetical protein